MYNLERIQRLMQEHATPDYLFPPATIERIREAEAVLGVSFPLSYQWFLLQYGYAVWPDYVYGISSEAPLGLSVVSITNSSRTFFEPRLHSYLIPVSPDGWGNHYCLDTSRAVNGEAPVIFWNHESDNLNLEITHETFLDFFEELCLQEVQWEDEERRSNEHYLH